MFSESTEEGQESDDQQAMSSAIVIKNAPSLKILYLLRVADNDLFVNPRKAPKSKNEATIEN